MTQTLPNTSEADEIQQQMRGVRAELRANVKDLMNSAQDMADWTRYVRSYPWLCVAAAAAAGYLIVPSRSLIIQPDAESLAKLAKEHRLFLNPAEGPAQKKKGGFISQLISVAAAAALQGGLRIASQQMQEAFNTGRKAHSNGQAGAHHD